jgi:hypothetical protein
MTQPSPESLRAYIRGARLASACESMETEELCRVIAELRASGLAGIEKSALCLAVRNAQLYRQLHGDQAQHQLDHMAMDAMNLLAKIEAALEDPPADGEENGE